MLSDAELLLYILEQKAKQDLFTTSKISKSFPVSQQTISRKLRYLEKKGYLKRSVSIKGVELSLTDEGKHFLHNFFLRLKTVFMHQKRRYLEGSLTAGLGEGRYYLSLTGYVSKLKEILGLDVFPGTLNLHVDPWEFMDFIQGMQEHVIPGFRTRDRTYGELSAYRVMIADRIEGAILLPKRTHYDKSTIEVIAPLNLRKKLSLEDKDIVKLHMVKS